MGERSVRNAEVVGSIPICSTRIWMSQYGRLEYERQSHGVCPVSDKGRARRGGSGALYPQSAKAGLNSRAEVSLSRRGVRKKRR